MIKYIQKNLNPGTGDCFRTCIASMMEVEHEAIPNFMEDGEDKFKEKLLEWQNKTGIIFIDINIQDLQIIKNCLVIAVGKSPRGEWNHSVLWKNGKVVHDPHPSGDGLDGEPKHYCLFFYKNPILYRNGVMPLSIWA